jgi:AmmeMemoRadiSam system protein B
MEKLVDIRPSPLAGRWYPANPRELADSVDGYIQAANLPEIKGNILALVSPHAGHIYSGPVAGYAFKSVQGLQPDLVIILSPYHQFHQDSILTSGHQAYQTPLGEVPVDEISQEDLSRALYDARGIKLSKVRNDGEHAVEILLPFLQRSLAGNFSLLPLMLRNQDPKLMKTLGTYLADLSKQRNVLIVASSDLSHFHPAEKANQLDQTIIECIQTLDPEALYQAEITGSGSACGLGALAAVIWAAESTNNPQAQILKYAHSGDITGDISSVVGYTSAVLTSE